MKGMRELRKIRGWTQQELAEKIGLSQETISQYENGTRTPNIIIAKRIAQAIQEPLDNISFDKNISK